jgi:hypothetical protein
MKKEFKDLVNDDKFIEKIVEKIINNEKFINKLGRHIMALPTETLGLNAPGNILEFFSNDRFKGIRESE